MSKVYEGIYKAVLIILGICTVYCFVISVFGKKQVYDYNAYILIMGIIVYIGIICVLYQKCKELTDKKLNYIIIVMLASYFMLTLIFGLRIKSERPADIFNLHNAAISYLNTGEIQNIDYFSHYPYQLNYTYILIAVYKIGSLFGIEDFRTSGTLFGTLLLFFSAILVWKIAEIIKDKSLGVMALFTYVTNPVFWIYSSYYYTDLMGMLCILLIIYIALYINKNKASNLNCLLSFFLGFIIFSGYKFRATVIIGGVAVFALGIVKIDKTKEKINFYNIVAVVLGIVLAILVHKGIDSYFGIELDKNKQFPIVHWIMMGLSEKSNGRWSGELWNYTNSFPTYNEKILADIEAINQSLSEMGVLGIIRLLFTKLTIMWTDGMTALTTNFGTSVHYGNLYEYTIGNKNAFMCYATQIMRASLFVCLVPYLFYELKQKFSRKSILAVTFWGYILFYSIWEVHEKYVLMFLPLLIIMAVYGLEVIIELCNDFRKIIIINEGRSYTIYKINIFQGIEKLYWGVCVVTIILSVFSWSNMVIKAEKKYDYVVYQSNSSGSISIREDAVKQTFLTNLDFNAIYIRFLNDNVPNEQQYTFSLYDNSGVCLYQEKFSANDINNDTYHSFNFDIINVDTYHEFNFDLVADAEYENTIEVCIAGNNYSDLYGRGKCSILGEENCDMTFRVYNVRTEGYYSKIFYISIVALLILMEIGICIAIYYGKKSKNIREEM